MGSGRALTCAGKLFAVVAALSAPAFACTTIVAGKNATVTGRVILGHNEDDRGNFQVLHAFVPRRTFSEGATIPAEKGLAKIPQAGKTLGMYWAEVNGGSWHPSFADVFLNERGVAVVSNNGRGKPQNDAAQLVDGGLAWVLRRAVADHLMPQADLDRLCVSPDAEELLRLMDERAKK